MATEIATKALVPNPALKPFGALLGEWQTAGSHPYVPKVTLHGRTSFEWLEGGAFLIMRSEIDEPHFPHGVAIFASDDAANGKSPIGQATAICPGQFWFEMALVLLASSALSSTRTETMIGVPSGSRR
jgi:hypothetical protein